MELLVNTLNKLAGSRKLNVNLEPNFFFIALIFQNRTGKFKNFLVKLSEAGLSIHSTFSDGKSYATLFSKVMTPSKPKALNKFTATLSAPPEPKWGIRISLLMILKLKIK
ncbi:MAG: hypothetical protein H5T71_09885 [Chloroflexi bacterium]|nr:hypothetical protein [Chloroflexota bacterium]